MGKYLHSVRGKPDPFGYHSRIKKLRDQNMAPITRSQSKKRAASRGRTPTRVTARRVDLPTPRSTSRGRQMSRSTSRNRSMSMGTGSVRRRLFGRTTRRAFNRSKSSGFLATYRKSRKALIRKPFVHNGVTYVKEVSSVASAEECLWIGHSVPLTMLKYNAFWALLKALFVKANGFVQNFASNTLLTDCGAQNNDIIRMVYKIDANGSPTTFDRVVGTTAGTTVDTLVNAFANEPVIDSQGIQVIDFRYISAGTGTSTSDMNQAVLRCQNAKIYFDVKLDLKLQNRSIQGSTDTDDVTNQPVYGKSYEGIGIGPVVKGHPRTAGTNFSANTATGMIVRSNNSTLVPAFEGALERYAEPLDYQYFQNVDKIGKIHIDSGQLKTSVIHKKMVFVFSNFLNMINEQSIVPSNTTGGIRSYMPRKLAEYRLFACEKMIDAVVSGGGSTIDVAFEHNIKIMSNFKAGGQAVTGIKFEKTRITGPYGGGN